MIVRFFRNQYSVTCRTESAVSPSVTYHWQINQPMIFYEFRFAMTVLYQKLRSNRPFCENRLSNCHTFIVMLYILFSFKHQTNKPIPLTVERNQWKEKAKISELRKYSKQVDILFHNTNKILSPYNAPLLPPNHQYTHYIQCTPHNTSLHLTTCTLTTSNVHLTILHTT